MRVIASTYIRQLRSRLVGTEVVHRFGRNITGLYADEAYSGEYLAQVMETYSTIIESRRPHLSRHNVPIKGRDHVNYDRLILPLAADGETVDMFLTCFTFDDTNGDWTNFAGPENAI